MNESIKINTLELENVKRIKAVKLEPSANGLTVIGGKNRQGKTSVLDSISWALGGDRYEPSKAKREGSTIPPNLKVVLSNGMIVERKGKNSSLKVTDANGKKGGQTLLKEFIEQLALDLPKFMNASNKEKANTLLQIIGVGEQLAKFTLEESQIYSDRLYKGQEADRKKKFAEEQTHYPEAPKELVSAAVLIDQQQRILVQNGENQRKRENVDRYELNVKVLTEDVARLTKMLRDKQSELNKAQNDLTIAKMDTIDLHDESTEQLQRDLMDTEEINRKVRANLDKEKAEEDAKVLKDQYDVLTMKLNTVRKNKTDLLDGADLPLPELSIEDEELTYQGQKWDNMSGSDQLKVSTAIVRKLNPKCGFVLLDKLEQMDIDTMNEFGQWLEQEGLQAIATRVSTGDECSIIIEDGYAIDEHLEENELKKSIVEKPQWKAGEF